MTILRKFDNNSRLKKKKKKKINHDNTYTDTSSGTRDNCFFNGDEKEVAKILQQLHQFILESESSAYPFLSITWGIKKRRSLTNGSQAPPPPPLSITCYSPPPSPPPCNCVRTISKPLSFSFSDSFPKLSTCKRKTSNKAKMKMKKSIDAITSSPQKQENQIKTFVKLMTGDCNDQRCRNLELKSNPSFLQQREKLHSNSNRKRRRRSFDLSSAVPTVFSPAPEEEEEESKGSLTKVAADPSRMRSEMNEKSQYPYSQIAHSLSGEVGLVMAKHLNPLGIPDLNFAPEENFFKSFDMNKQPPLQMC